MRLDDYEKVHKYPAKVLGNERMTPEASKEDVRELLLEVGGEGFECRAGQSIGVLVPGPHKLGHKQHFRLYTIADEPAATEQGKQIRICVRRCDYIDEYSGERYPGIASNFLCDRSGGDTFDITGPYKPPFAIPEDKDSNLLLIGMGTGIAPFRVLVKQIYSEMPDWQGRVRLFYGARTGLEMLYMNDQKDDFALYYDQETFEAIKALSPRPHWDERVGLDQALEERQEEVWELLGDSRTHVYVAGLESIRESLDKAFARMAGSEEKWQRRKAELTAGGRWVELIF